MLNSRQHGARCASGKYQNSRYERATSNDMLTTGEQQPAAARPSHSDAAEHDPPPAYIPNNEPLPPTYQDISQLKDDPPRPRWFRSRLFLAVVLTLVTAAIIASLAAVFTIQAKKQVREVRMPVCTRDDRPC